jgi:hypothetical protein
MIKKITAMAVALIAALAMIGFSASPASALMSKEKCENYGVTTHYGTGYTVTVCVEVLYRAQSDGSGWAVEDLYVDVNNGCSNLEDWPKVYNNFGAIKNIQNEYIRTYNLSDMDCHAYRDIEWGVPSGGEAEFVGRLATKNATDVVTTIRFLFGTN